MKRLLNFMIMAAIAIAASAYQFKAGILCYNINKDGRTVTVTYESLGGINTPINYLYSSIINIPSTVKHNKKIYTVTAIGDRAFFSCRDLTKVTIPSTVKKIGVGAFANNHNLKSVSIPNSVTTIGYGAFIGCDNLTVVNIPTSLTSIPDAMFATCTSLKSIIIPASVTSIGEKAFSACPNLQTVVVRNKRAKIASDAFTGCPKLSSDPFLSKFMENTAETEGISTSSTLKKVQAAMGKTPGTEGISTQTEQIFTYVDTAPEYPGGNSALLKFLSDNIVYPEEAAKKGICGKVIVQFVVEKDGSVGDIKVLRSIDRLLDEEAKRVIKLLKLKPGMSKGKPARVWFTLPIDFKLQ